MKKIVMVGLHEIMQNSLPTAFPEMSFVFFDFEKVEDAMNLAIAENCPIVLRFKTMPWNGSMLTSWLDYLNGKLPTQYIAITHQATASQKEMDFLGELGNQNYKIVDLMKLGDYIIKSL